MNIVNKLTLRHIKTHQKRSVLTVLAIIVSVAMVTAVFTSIFSFIKFMQDSTEAYDGSWHVQFVYDGPPSTEAFQNNSDIADYYVSAEYTEISCDAQSDSQRVRCDIDTVDPSVVNIRNIRITQGRFPEKEGELLLTEDYLEKNKLDWKVGDTLTIPTRSYDTAEYTDKEYTLTGIAEGNVSYFDHCGGAVRNTGQLPADVTSFVTVSFKKLDSSVYDKSAALAKASGADSYRTNTDLLSYSGVMRNNETLYSIGGFAAVILAVIVIASVVMIYDSFAVSYQERERYLGMLASVGATKRQKRSSIYFEGFLLGAVAIPIGLVAGFAGMAVTFKGIRGSILKMLTLPIQDTLQVHFSPYIVLGTVLISALTIFISCLIPARRASQTTPINAIRGTNTVKVKKAKRLRVSKTTRKLFGYEGELAVKNFKRNGRRSRNIVFALVMSVVLFLTVTNFSAMLDTLVKSEAGEGSADFTLAVEAKNSSMAEAYLRNQSDADSVIGYSILYGRLKDTALLTDDAKRVLHPDGGGDNLCLFCLDNESFDAYLKEIGETTDGYHDKKNPRAIVFNQVIDTAGGKPKTYEAFRQAEGKDLHCVLSDYDEEGNESQKEIVLTAGKLTDKAASAPLFAPKTLAQPSLILPADIFFSLVGTEGYFIQYGVFARDYKTVAAEADDYFSSRGIYYSLIDNATNIEALNAVLSVMKVFIYGFISLISLIAIINIINSIANSMNERRREFAMLKSVGVTPKGFQKMIYVESLRYGVKSLLWSIPISFGLHYLMYYALSTTEDLNFSFALHPQYYLLAGGAVLLIILVSLLYSADKMKDDSIIENLKEDI